MLQFLLSSCFIAFLSLFGCSGSERTSSVRQDAAPLSSGSPESASAQFNLKPDGSDLKILSAVGVVNPGILTVVPVRLVDGAGVAVPNTVVQFAGPVAQAGINLPQISLSSPTATSNTNGYAYVTFQGASAPGQFSVTVSSPTYPLAALNSIQFSSPGITINGGRIGRANINSIEIGLFAPANASTILSSISSTSPRLKLDFLSSGSPCGFRGCTVTGRIPLSFTQATGSATTYGMAITFTGNCFGGSCTSANSDGIYEIQVDEDGDGVFEFVQRFHRLLGDVDGNSIVELADRTIIEACVSSTPGRLSAQCTNADLDSSRTINGLDINILTFTRGHRVLSY